MAKVSAVSRAKQTLCQGLGDFRCRYRAAAAGILPTPQKAEVAASCAFRRGTQRPDSCRCKRKSGRFIIRRAQFLNDPIYDATSSAPGEQCRDDRVTGGVALQCGTIESTNRRFGAKQI